jgi:methylisocitrate lyase
MRRICAAIDAPLMANNIEGGLTPLLPATELEAIGYAMVAFPVATTYAVAAAIRGLMQHLHTNGTTAGFSGEMLDFTAFNALVGLPQLRAAEERDLAFARQLAGRVDQP